MGLFETLTSKGGSPLSTDELAKITNSDRIFLGKLSIFTYEPRMCANASMIEARVLRYLASFGMIQEIAEDLWSASNITKTFSIPGLKAGIHHKSGRPPPPPNLAFWPADC